MELNAIYSQTLRHFLAPVAELLFDDEAISENERVTEVLINGPHEIYYEQNGRLVKSACRFADEESLWAAVRNLAEFVNRPIGDERHSMDARLPEPQHRVHVIIPPCSRRGVCVSIRKFRRSNATLSWMIQRGALDEAAAEYLELAVKMHRNVIVSGGTGAGKTSLLNALSGAIPEHERIIVIEDSAELQLQQAHAIYLEAKPAQAEGRAAVTIRDLFVDSLRMRPDRIVVGEVRRGEALDLVQSMLSGHDGSLSTVHASSPAMALVRLETMCMMSDVSLPVHVARTQVASAIHVIAQISRFPDGSRRVTHVSEVRGMREHGQYAVEDLFRFQVDRRTPNGSIQGHLKHTGAKSDFSREALELGFMDHLSHSTALFESV